MKLGRRQHVTTISCTGKHIFIYVKFTTFEKSHSFILHTSELRRTIGYGQSEMVILTENSGGSKGGQSGHAPNTAMAYTVGIRFYG